jgi:hypothetical protein
LFGRLALVRRCAKCRKEAVVVVAEEVVEEEHADGRHDGGSRLN